MSSCEPLTETASAYGDGIGSRRDHEAHTRIRWRNQQRLGTTMMRTQAHMLFNYALKTSRHQYGTLPRGRCAARRRVRGPTAGRDCARVGREHDVTSERGGCLAGAPVSPSLASAWRTFPCNTADAGAAVFQILSVERAGARARLGDAPAAAADVRLLWDGHQPAALGRQRGAWWVLLLRRRAAQRAGTRFSTPCPPLCAEVVDQGSSPCVVGAL